MKPQLGSIVHYVLTAGERELDGGIGMVIDRDVAPGDPGLFRIRFADGRSEWIHGDCLVRVS